MSSDLADEPLAEEMRLSVLVNAAGLKDTILMPLQVGSRRIGMIQVSNKRSVGGFSAAGHPELAPAFGAGGRCRRRHASRRARSRFTKPR